VRTAIGLYFLGGLSAEDEAVVEWHLARCETCLAEYSEHSEIPFYLGALEQRDIDDLFEPPAGGITSQGGDAAVDRQRSGSTPRIP
jgi:hypothetical protein